ncbi:GNAT family N-acetyltransferase [Methanoculleus sp.]|uniref:GNAT family N-acetyltransferase n=1 Tax=Methanoculleus sp. TaxID=90427 RepID=UPI0025DE71CB|nr:GNAT family N-acetyltransferase [Methanoculleus sp.]
MAYSVEPLSGDNAHQWETFNHHSREGTLFHSLRWKKILEDIFGFNLRYYLIQNEQKIIGICPFVERIRGYFRGLEDIPHSNFNDVILDDSFNISDINDLLSLFSQKCSYLRFNVSNADILERITYSNFSGEETGNMVLDLKQTPPDTIQQTLSKNTLKRIRRFEKEGFRIQEITRRSDIGQFYQYYAKNMAHIRGKILPLSFFEMLWDFFAPNELRIVILTKEDVCAGGTLALVDPARKIVHHEYLALNRNLPHYTPTYYLDWDLIDWAWANGYEMVSLGRQKLDPDNPRFRDKAKFGAEHIPIHSRLVIFSKKVSPLYRLKRTLSRSS